MDAIKKSSTNNSDSLQIIAHQLGFLLTGLCTTLGVQWLFYRGAASMYKLMLLRCLDRCTLSVSFLI